MLNYSNKRKASDNLFGSPGHRHLMGSFCWVSTIPSKNNNFFVLLVSFSSRESEQIWNLGFRSVVFSQVTSQNPTDTLHHPSQCLVNVSQRDLASPYSLLSGRSIIKPIYR